MMSSSDIQEGCHFVTFPTGYLLIEMSVKQRLSILNSALPSPRSLVSLRHFFRWYDFPHDHHPLPPVRPPPSFSHRHKLKIFGAVSCSSIAVSQLSHFTAAHFLAQPSIKGEGIKGSGRKGHRRLQTRRVCHCLLVLAWETGATRSNKVQLRTIRIVSLLDVCMLRSAHILAQPLIKGEGNPKFDKAGPKFF